MPKWTKAPAEMVALFGRVIEGLPEVAPRPMFGYPAAFVHGHMFGGLFQDGMILRLSEADRAAFERDHGANTFEPMGRPMREYRVVPAAVLRSDASLREWVGRAHGYAASLPPKRPGGRKKTTPAKAAAKRKR